MMRWTWDSSLALPKGRRNQEGRVAISGERPREIGAAESEEDEITTGLSEMANLGILRRAEHVRGDFEGVMSHSRFDRLLHAIA